MNGEIVFHNKEAFWLLAIIPLIVWVYYFFYKSKNKGFNYSSLFFLKSFENKTYKLLSHIPFVLFLIALVFFIIALARPQKVRIEKDIVTYGFDIFLVWDISSSMNAIDFKPKNRFEVSKEVVKEFIKKRTNDRIGVVLFAGEAYTRIPLTFDKNIVLKLLNDVECVSVDGSDKKVIQDGTAIGDALALAIKRLKNSTAKSKLIILVTDGDNNAGYVDPEIAADIALKEGIKIYTIGIGKKGGGLVPIKTPFGIQYAQTGEVNDLLLSKIAEKTKGVYRRAQNKKQLEEIYDYIDKNEKSEIKIKTYKEIDELFYKYLTIGVMSLVVGLFTGLYLFRIE